MNSELTFKVSSGVTTATAEELGAQVSPYTPIPAEYQALHEEYLQEVKTVLMHKVEKRLSIAKEAAQKVRAHRLGLGNGGNGGFQPQAGEPVEGLDYEYWDVAMLSPQQFIVPPLTFRPQKIIAGGEFVILTAVLFINPFASPPGGVLGGPSATQYLASRDFRIQIQNSDITTMSAGPSFTFAGTFPALAPVLSFFSVGFVPPNPGVNTHVWEMNVTADVSDPLQPFAAWATQWADIEDDPGWPMPQSGGARHQTPLRYLIYPK
jgi:hypothetical protein